MHSTLNVVGRAREFYALLEIRGRGAVQLRRVQPAHEPEGVDYSFLVVE